MSLHLLRKAHSTNYAAMRGMGDASQPDDDGYYLCPECMGDKKDKDGEPCEFCGGDGYYYEEPAGAQR